MRRQKLDTAEWAKFWRVEQRSIQRWLKAGRPVVDLTQMARIILAQRRSPLGARTRAQEILMEESRKSKILETAGKATPDDGTKISTPPQWQKEVPLSQPSAKAGLEIPPEYQPPPTPQPTDEEVAETEVDLKTLATRFYLEIKRAQKTNDQGNISFWTEKFIVVNKAIRADELHAKKMGLEKGEYLSRQEVCRIIHAMAFWTVQGIDKDLAAVCPKLVGCTYVEEVHAILDRFLLRKRFLATFTRAATYPTGVQLPAWLVETLRDAVDDYYENGAPTFDRYMALFDNGDGESDKVGAA